MKTQKLKRMMSLFLAALMCVTTLVGFGTTAYAAEETDEVCLVSFPRDGDANYGGEWGHGSCTYVNGWRMASSRYTTVRAMGSYDGNICYCIEPGVPQESGDRFTQKGENFLDNYPSSFNGVLAPDDIKLFIGRIFQYGYTGTISTSWRSQNEGGDKLAHAVATQLLVWETVVGERDADFNKVGTGGRDAICDQISTSHPLYSQIMSYYNSIAASVQNHTKVPSFFAKSTGKAKNIELEWDGEKYTATLTDTNNVLSNYTFSASTSEIRFSVNGNKLTITADTAPNDTVTITAEKKNSQRRGVITWTDGKKIKAYCRYIDETHTQIGKETYYICEFAERIEACGASYAPAEPPMPEMCYSTLPSSGEVIKVFRRDRSYILLKMPIDSVAARRYADDMNRRLGVSKAQEAAMLAGSMFGWSVPAADAKNYDENGNPRRPKSKDRGDAR